MANITVLWKDKCPYCGATIEHVQHNGGLVHVSNPDKTLHDCEGKAKALGGRWREIPTRK